jgi:hypothetical protein
MTRIIEPPMPPCSCCCLFPCGYSSGRPGRLGSGADRPRTAASARLQASAPRPTGAAAGSSRSGRWSRSSTRSPSSAAGARLSRCCEGSEASARVWLEVASVGDRAWRTLDERHDRCRIEEARSRPPVPRPRRSWPDRAPGVERPVGQIRCLVPKAHHAGFRDVTCDRGRRRRMVALSVATALRRHRWTVTLVRTARGGAVARDLLAGADRPAHRVARRLPVRCSLGSRPPTLLADPTNSLCAGDREFALDGADHDNPGRGSCLSGSRRTEASRGCDPDRGARHQGCAQV